VASKPYQTCVDLDGPAYRCSCPSRKFPCKHALGLLLLWAAGSVAVTEAPGWVAEWQAARSERAAKTQARRDAAPAEATPQQVQSAARRSAQRADRVDSGVAELAQWLDDQVRHGIAGLDQAGYAHFDAVAARLVDAQAPGLARDVRALASVVSSGAGWDERLLAALSELRLVTRAYARIDALPEPLAETVRARVGFTMPAERVLASPPIRDTWQVIGARDEVDERLTTRRAWLLGRHTGRFALVLSFAVPGQPLPADLVVGTAIDADLHFYPGSVPLRATVGTRHAAPESGADVAPATAIAAALDAYTEAVAGDPWTTRWPMLVRGVLVPGDRWHVRDEAGDALPLDPPGGRPWHLVAAGGGRTGVLAGEWSAAGLRPLALYADAEVVSA
jgi:hypothetical protein